MGVENHPQLLLHSNKLLSGNNYKYTKKTVLRFGQPVFSAFIFRILVATDLACIL